MHCCISVLGYTASIAFVKPVSPSMQAISIFPTDDSLLKMLYLAMIDITKKWTGKRKDWGQIHSQLEIFFADRLPQ